MCSWHFEHCAVIGLELSFTMEKFSHGPIHVTCVISCMCHCASRKLNVVQRFICCACEAKADWVENCQAGQVECMFEKCLLVPCGQIKWQ